MPLNASPGYPGGGIAVRCRKDDYVAIQATSLVAIRIAGRVTVQYDDGTFDDLQFPDTALSVGFTFLICPNRVNGPGWVIGAHIYTPSTPFKNATYVQVYLNRGEEVAAPNVIDQIACGYVDTPGNVVLGRFEPHDRYATWVFQGTVAEDGTGGTHVCSLTVTPGAGNEMQVLYGTVTVGNTATAQTAAGSIDDGTNNILADLFNPAEGSGTTANLRYQFPGSGFPTTAQSATMLATPVSGLIVSGTMRLRLVVSTAAISVTQTFAVACRIRGNALPTATLADTVGTPVLTVNTSAVFG